jgi:putative intracellular protease/amidase
LRADPRFVALTKAFAEKPIFAICHGPQLLMTLGIMLRGRRLTAVSPTTSRPSSSARSSCCELLTQDTRR